MQNKTREFYNKFVAQVATLNGVPSATETFAVEPTIQQTLMTKIQDSSAFLKLINIFGVDELSGEKVGITVSGPIASRANTNGGDGSVRRQPRDVKALDAKGYKLAKTNYDTFTSYATLDSWAKFPDFQTRLRDSILKKQALDLLMIGWNGTSVAANTNLTANPLLQDVNIGWLEQIRVNSPQRYMKEVVAGSGKVKIGAAGDYKNLDALVYDVVNSMVEPWYRDNPEMRVILGRELNVDYTIPQINEYFEPQSREALQRLIEKSRIGGVPATTVPYFTSNSLLITIPANLSIYFQNGARRRQLRDEPEYDRITNYESSNDGYVVEDYGAAVLVENIEFV